MLETYPSKLAGTNLHIRWMIRRDSEEVLAIEQTSFEQPWVEEDFLIELRKRNVIGMVVELRGGRYPDKIVGHMVYGLMKNRIDLLRISVHPDYRGVGVGSAMIQKLTTKLASHRRNRIEAVSSELDLPAHLFFRATGFIAVEVLPRWEDDDTDAYLFVLRIRDEVLVE